jgi:hypothetical protein
LIALIYVYKIEHYVMQEFKLWIELNLASLAIWFLGVGAGSFRWTLLWNYFHIANPKTTSSKGRKSQQWWSIHFTSRGSWIIKPSDTNVRPISNKCQQRLNWIVSNSLVLICEKGWRPSWIVSRLFSHPHSSFKQKLADRFASQRNFEH